MSVLGLYLSEVQYLGSSDVMPCDVIVIHVIPGRVRVFFLIHSEFNSNERILHGYIIDVRKSVARGSKRSISDRVSENSSYHTSNYQSP